MLNLKFSHLSEETPGLVTLEFFSGEIIPVAGIIPVALRGTDRPSGGMVVNQAIPVRLLGVNGDQCGLSAIPIFSIDLHGSDKPKAIMVADGGFGVSLCGHDRPHGNMSIVVVIPVAMHGVDVQHGKMIVRGISKRRVDDGIRRGACNLQFSSGNLFSNALEFDPKYRKPPPIANRASISISSYVP